MRRETPEPWASAIVHARCVAPDGRPSLNKLSERCGVAVETLARLVHGEGRPSASTLLAVSRVLGSDVYEWVGRRKPAADPYQPPAEAHLLDEEQRRTLDAVIRAMARPAVPYEIREVRRGDMTVTVATTRELTPEDERQIARVAAQYLNDGTQAQAAP